MHTSFRSSAGQQALALLAFFALCLTIGGIGGAVTSTSVGTWYQQLHKPSFNPPDWVFGPVWTALYIAMAVAAWRVWRRLDWGHARHALSLFAIQLLLNLSWTILFFGFRQIGLALLEIAVLSAVIVATAIAFWRSDRCRPAVCSLSRVGRVRCPAQRFALAPQLVARRDEGD
jgi:tryptophan-rich sensory protein